MTDSLATKQDLKELEARIDARFVSTDAHFVSIDARFNAVDARFNAIDTRFEELEKRIALRFVEQSSRFDAKLADLERRMTMRLGGITVACFGAFSALTKIL